MDDVMGDVVAEIRSEKVTMFSNGKHVKARVEIPSEVCGGYFTSISVDTDFKTARRMVEGDVYLMLVVSDGGSDD